MKLIKFVEVKSDCPTCRGAGWIVKGVICWGCNGRGYTESLVQEPVEVSNG